MSLLYTYLLLHPPVYKFINRNDYLVYIYIYIYKHNPPRVYKFINRNDYLVYMYKLPDWHRIILLLDDEAQLV